MNKYVEEIIEENRKAWGNRSEVNPEFTEALLKFAQSVCTHTGPGGEDLMEEDGYDSHKTYYKCSNCGKETSV